MSNNIGEMQRVVVCAANRYTGNNRFIGPLIILGARHFDSRMNTPIRALNLAGFNLKPSEWEQGFIDQLGVFMDRTKALAVATAAGQINVRRAKTAPYDELFSEDLY